MSCAKRFVNWALPVLVLTVAYGWLSNTSQAAVVFDGTVAPAASGDWDADTDGYVGTSGGTGSLLIDNASGLEFKDGYIGDAVGGTVTVDGAGSTLTGIPIWVENQYMTEGGYYAGGANLYIGKDSGVGVLNVTNGGAYTNTFNGPVYGNAGRTYVGYDGHGDMYLQNGSTVINQSGFIGGGNTGTGAVTVSGNSTWTNDGTLYTGYGGTGTLTIDTGGTVTSSSGYIGYKSAGTMTITGAGSTYNTGELQVGKISYGGNVAGRLNIENDGYVEIARDTMVLAGWGTIHFDGGTLKQNTTLYAPGTSLTGAGTINTNGLVSDISLTFDGASTGVGGFGTAGTITVDTSSGSSVLGMGYGASAEMTIKNGATITTATGYLGHQSGSSGTATVSESATWDCHEIYVGASGTGRLNITGGGTASHTTGYIGYESGSTGVVDVAGDGAIWAMNLTWDPQMQHYYGGDLYVGRSGNGTLSISNGGVVSVGGTTLIGSESGGTGVIDFNAGTLTTQSLYAKASQLTGTGNIVTNGLVSDMSMTFDSMANLSQTFTFSGSNVDVMLDMSDSSTQGDLGVGYISNASLVVTNGVTIGTNGTGRKGYLGYKSGSTGTAEVSGAATWNCDNLYVGNAGKGILNITGGTVNTDTGEIGYEETSSGTVTLDGAGSAWNVGHLSVGRQSLSGWLCIYNGGVVNSTTAIVGVGYDGYGAGILRVDGSGSKFSAQSLTVGQEKAQGTLQIQNGGVVEVGGRIDLGKGYYGSGSAIGNIFFNGGTLQYTGTTPETNWITVGVNSDSGSGNVYIQADGATLGVSNATSAAISVALKTHATSTGGGLTKTGAGTLILSGANTYTGLTSVTEGVLKLVDTSPGWTGAFKPIFNGGSASLGVGALLFNYDSTYNDATALSNVLSAITAGKIFAADNTPPLLCSGNSDTDTVTVMNTLYGDANVDGSVNGTDLNAVLSYYNQSGQAWANGDFNFDGSVNGTDLNTVLSNYNQSVSFASTAAVPEPSTLLLMVLGLVGLLAWRKRFGIC